jgi:hypothetical protein
MLDEGGTSPSYGLEGFARLSTRLASCTAK